MQREKGSIAPPCIVPGCRRDATDGPNCNPHHQAILRRCRNGRYKREELIARGKLHQSSLDRWLSS